MLNREEIKELMSNGLIVGCPNIDIQLTPNGFDLTVGEVFKFKEAGAIDFSNKERNVPETLNLRPLEKTSGDTFGWWDLPPGAYKIRTNEIIHLPYDIVAIAFPRSSLLRVGAFTQTGVWDAGFEGKSEFILVVHNPQGLQLKQNARIVQLVFERVRSVEQGYQGIYQEGE